jgi:hypothetical protein
LRISLAPQGENEGDEAEEEKGGYEDDDEDDEEDEEDDEDNYSAPMFDQVTRREIITVRKRPILCLAYSKILTPTPLSARRVCPPRLWCGGRTHSPGIEGGGGQYFGRRKTQLCTLPISNPL